MLHYFNFDEFDCPTEQGSGAPTTEGGKMNLDFLHKLDDARRIANVSFKITSGYRTEKHNLTVGGRVGSSHTKGLAADILCENSSKRSAILKGLFQAGLGRRVGIGDNFVHVDVDMNKPAAIWLYS